MCASLSLRPISSGKSRQKQSLQGLYFDDPRIVDALAGGAAGMSVPAVIAGNEIVPSVYFRRTQHVELHLQGGPQLCS